MTYSAAGAPTFGGFGAGPDLIERVDPLYCLVALAVGVGVGVGIKKAGWVQPVKKETEI